MIERNRSINPKETGRARMIRNAGMLQNFEKELIRKEPVDVSANFRIVEALYQEAVRLGVFLLKDPMDGLETIIKIAKVVNSVPGTPRPHSTGTR
jgi:hypothetical protein